MEPSALQARARHRVFQRNAKPPLPPSSRQGFVENRSARTSPEVESNNEAALARRVRMTATRSARCVAARVRVLEDLDLGVGSRRGARSKGTLASLCAPRRLGAPLEHVLSE